MISACSGELTSDMKKPAAAIPTTASSQGPGIATSQIEAIWQRNAPAVIASGVEAAHEAQGGQRADERPAAERAEEPSEDARIRVERRHDEHRQRREEHRPRGVEQREGRRPEAQQPVAEDEPDADEDAPLVGRRLDLGHVHERERRARTRRDRSRRRRRARSTLPMRPIRMPAAGGPRKIVSRFAAWKNAVASAMSSCSSPTSSGTTERCTAKYGAMKTPVSRDEDEEQRERQLAGRVQDRDRGEQRRAGEVADRASSASFRAARRSRRPRSPAPRSGRSPR